MSTRFDEAVTAVITGDAAALKKLLQEDPGLIEARAPSEHRSTLLHYVGANGIEDELQKTPPNAVEITRILLDAGAEVDSLAGTYGGDTNQTTLCLLVSSCHPAEAGLQPDLVKVLCDAGAAVNGVADDGAPLATALMFSYTKSVDMLVQCGARIDNLLFSAGAGDLDRVRSWFGSDGRLDPAAVYDGPHFPIARDEKELVEQAFGLACYHLRLDTIRFLIEQGVDVNSRTRILGGPWTGLYWAAHGFHTQEEERPVLEFLKSIGVAPE